MTTKKPGPTAVPSKAVAEPVAYLDNKPQSWVTTCPHCDRIIGITLKGNGK